MSSRNRRTTSRARSTAAEEAGLVGVTDGRDGDGDAAVAPVVPPVAPGAAVVPAGTAPGPVVGPDPPAARCSVVSSAGSTAHDTPGAAAASSRWRSRDP